MFFYLLFIFICLFVHNEITYEEIEWAGQCFAPENSNVKIMEIVQQFD